MNTWIKLHHLIHNCSMLSVCASPVCCGFYSASCCGDLEGAWPLRAIRSAIACTYYNLQATDRYCNWQWRTAL